MRGCGVVFKMDVSILLFVKESSLPQIESINAKMLIPVNGVGIT